MNLLALSHACVTPQVSINLFRKHLIYNQVYKIATVYFASMTGSIKFQVYKETVV